MSPDLRRRCRWSCTTSPVHVRARRRRRICAFRAPKGMNRTMNPVKRWWRMRALKRQPQWYQDVMRERYEYAKAHPVDETKCTVRMRSYGAIDCWWPCELDVGHTGLHEWRTGDGTFVRFSTRTASLSAQGSSGQFVPDESHGVI